MILSNLDDLLLDCKMGKFLILPRLTIHHECRLFRNLDRSSPTEMVFLKECCIRLSVCPIRLVSTIRLRNSRCDRLNGMLACSHWRVCMRCYNDTYTCVIQMHYVRAKSHRQLYGRISDSFHACASAMILACAIWINHKLALSHFTVDGTVAAYRLPALLSGDSVVFKQDSKWYEHFYAELQPWVHYIPVKEDLSDVMEQLHWARNHDK